MARRPLAIVFILLGSLPPGADAQFVERTPEEYAALAERAENAPLFQSHEPITITLTTDFEWLIDERSDTIEIDGTALFVDTDGNEVTKPVQVRARGNFRRDRSNCNFPPLRLDFPTGAMEGTVFEGQDKLKLVVPCHDDRDDYQNYVFDEYLAYRVFQTVTPLSFRVRPVVITFVDQEGDYDTRTKVGFLIEDDVFMAERNRAQLIEAEQFHPARMEGNQAARVALFNYMIGNSDWSPVYFHNAVLLRLEEGQYVTVPYDFDWSGVVSARYARPDPSLGTRTVRQRVFRGFCRPELTYEGVTPVFKETREQIRALYEGFAQLGYEEFDADDAEDTLEYYEEFYEVVDDPGDFERRIARSCRSAGSD